MIRAATQPDCRLSPRQVAERLGSNVDTVLCWIRSGELVAANLARKPTGRPRFKIREEDLNDFLSRRSTAKTAPPTKRPSRRKRAGYTEYIPL